MRYIQSSKKHPAVSVIMASYNYARFIKEAVDSVLAQKVSDWELLIVDDGSTDGSLEILAAYVESDSRIHLFQHDDKKNHGLPATLQLGTRHARGRYIAFLESDDVWTPECLEKRLRCLEKHPDAGAVFNDLSLLVMDGDSTHGDSVMVASMRKRFESYTSPFMLLDILLIQNCIPSFSCIMLNANILQKTSFKSPIPRWLDWWLWIQIARHSSFAYVNSACTLWRVHNSSYNNKHKLFMYIHDLSAMWQGFKTLLANHDGLSLQSRILLRLPVIFPLALRIADITVRGGLIGVLRRIRSKISFAA